MEKESEGSIVTKRKRENLTEKEKEKHMLRHKISDETECQK